MVMALLLLAAIMHACMAQESHILQYISYMVTNYMYRDYIITLIPHAEC